jgi:hypothetical protein
MELFVFARFHARAGQESAVEEALREVTGPSREEPTCLGFHCVRSTRDIPGCGSAMSSDQPTLPLFSKKLGDIKLEMFPPDFLLNAESTDHHWMPQTWPLQFWN